jgi:transketolase
MTALDTSTVVDLEDAARTIRRHVITQARAMGQAYVGQGLQSAELMAALCWSEMDWDPRESDNRDAFLLSVGHYAIAFYAMLAAQGVLDEEALVTYGADGSVLTLGGEPGEVPGMEFAGGSLGQGLGVGAGLAYGKRIQGKAGRTYVYLSDGEMQEGAVWEAAMFAGARGLSELVAIVDVNRTQADGELVLEIEPLGDKFRAFGWDVHEVDGHRLPEVLDAFAGARADTERPSVVIAHTRLAEGAPSLQARPNAHFVRVGRDEWDRVAAEVESYGRTAPDDASTDQEGTR